MEKPAKGVGQIIRGVGTRRRVLTRAGAGSLGVVLAWLGLSESSLTGRGGKAHAAPGDLVFACTGTGTSFYDPGVTETLQNNISIDSTMAFAGCLPPGAGVAVVTVDFAGQMDASCSTVIDFTGTGHIRYGVLSPLTTSTFSVDDFTIIRLRGQVVGLTSGTITSGAFAGDLVRMFGLRADLGACANPVIAGGGMDIMVVSEQ